MKKSKDITKYNLKWQMVRSKIKGPTVPFNYKIQAVKDYYDSEKTIDAWERVVNYLEGLQLGYKSKNPKAANIIQKEIDEYNIINKNDLLKEKDSFITLQDATKYSFEDRYNLWKDLFNRNKKWMEKGYVQKEINDFMDILYSLFKQNKEELSSIYSWDKLQKLRTDAAKISNTHKFFF